MINGLDTKLSARIDGVECSLEHAIERKINDLREEMLEGFRGVAASITSLGDLIDRNYYSLDARVTYLERHTATQG